MEMLTRLALRGYKTIREADVSLGPMNVLIGANGAGKSNLISFFKMLSWMTPRLGNLQAYIGKVGGANAILRDGAAVTPQMEAELFFQTERGRNDYAMRLFHAAPDTLIFADEKYRFSSSQYLTTAGWKLLGAGHRETRLLDEDARGDLTAKSILWLLRQCVVHQFHNTSETSGMRARSSVAENRYLREDAANLAPFLLRIRETDVTAYNRIVETLRQIVPFFSDFVLDPVAEFVMLQWRELGTGMVFGAHLSSDGTLRSIALISLLLQPEADLPAVIILDEPELGLHPYAIGVVAGLLKSAALHTQVIVATQSATLVDYFDPEEIVVVNRSGRESRFERLDSTSLAGWLAEYSMAELWEKNVIGGRPSR